MLKDAYLKRCCNTWNGMFPPPWSGHTRVLIARGPTPEGLSFGEIMWPVLRQRLNGVPKRGSTFTLMAVLVMTTIIR